MKTATSVPHIHTTDDYKSVYEQMGPTSVPPVCDRYTATVLQDELCTALRENFYITETNLVRGETNACE